MSTDEYCSVSATSVTSMPPHIATRGPGHVSLTYAAAIARWRARRNATSRLQHHDRAQAHLVLRALAVADHVRTRVVPAARHLDLITRHGVDEVLHLVDALPVELP